MHLTSCSMVSFGSSVFSSPLSFTASRFCQRFSDWVLFLSCSCNVGAAVTPDPAVGSPSLCRRCSISCCFEVSRYSWYKTSGHKHIIMIQKDNIFTLLDLLSHSIDVIAHYSKYMFLIHVSKHPIWQHEPLMNWLSSM